MFKRLLAAALVFGVAALAPPSATAGDGARPGAPAPGAGVFCAARTTLVEALTGRYGEAPLGVGLQGASGLVEIWTSRASGSWTLLLTRPNGMSCVLGSGVNWQTLNAGGPESAGDPA